MKTKPISAVLLFIFLLSAAHAQYPGLVPSYGKNGVSEQEFSDEVESGAFQQDGKLLVLTGGTLPKKLVLRRLLADGNGDNDFGNQSRINISYQNQYMSGYVQVLVQADQKILIGTAVQDSTEFNSIFLTRYTSKGQLDKSFGNNGVYTYRFDKYSSGFSQMLLQPDGKIVVTGQINQPGRMAANATILRVTTDGKTDQSFQNHVLSELNLLYSSTSSITRQPDGKLVIAGKSGNSGLPDFLIFRLEANGALDKQFNNNTGVFTHNVTSPKSKDLWGELNDVAVLNDGRILGVGVALSDTSMAAMVMLQPNGQYDLSFNKKGYAIIVGGSYYAYKSIAVDNKGQVYIGGTVRRKKENETVIFRLANTPSLLDESFYNRRFRWEEETGNTLEKLLFRQDRLYILGKGAKYYGIVAALAITN